MSKSIKRTWIAVMLAGAIAPATIARAADRSAVEILKALDGVKMPTVDSSRRSDPNYVQELRKQFKEAGEQARYADPRALQDRPESRQTAPLMAEHWERMVPFGPDAKKREGEIKDVLAHTKNPQVKVEALFAGAQGGVYKARTGDAVDLNGVEEFIKQAPKDQRGAQLLYVATFFSKDEKVKSEIEDRILKQFPDSQFRRPRSRVSAASGRRSASPSTSSSPTPSTARPSR